METQLQLNTNKTSYVAYRISDLRSLNFVIDRLFIKLLRTNNCRKMSAIF